MRISVLCSNWGMFGKSAALKVDIRYKLGPKLFPARYTDSKSANPSLSTKAKKAKEKIAFILDS